MWMDVSRAESCTLSQVRGAAPLLFALRALLIYVAWGPRFDTERVWSCPGDPCRARQERCTHRNHQEAEKWKWALLWNAVCTHPLGSLGEGPLGTGCQGVAKSLSYSQRWFVHTRRHRDVCTPMGAVTGEEGRQCLRGFAVTRVGSQAMIRAPAKSHPSTELGTSMWGIAAGWAAPLGGVGCTFPRSSIFWGWDWLSPPQGSDSVFCVQLATRSAIEAVPPCTQLCYYPISLICCSSRISCKMNSQVPLLCCYFPPWPISGYRHSFFPLMESWSPTLCKW